MNWMLVLWPMVAAACVTLALISLRIALGGGGRAPHLFFSLAALAVAAISGLELTLLQTDDLARYEAVMRAAAVPVWIMVASVTGFVWSFFGTGRPWLAWGGVGLNGLANAVNLCATVPAVRHAVALRHVETFAGGRFTVATVENGPWNVAEVISVILVVAFLCNASVTLWRKGVRRRAAIVGGSTVFFFLVARGHAVLIETGHLQAPYFVSFAFLGVLAAMGYELGGDVLRAATLAGELNESKHRIDLAARAAALGFWSWDIPRGEIWASATARAHFGFTPDESLSLRRVLATLHPNDRHPVKQAIEAAFRGARDYEAEYRVQPASGGMRWIAARGRAELNAAGRPLRMSGVIIDVTSRRQSEFELRQVRGQLAHSGRVSTLGQLASALAHELNQPLGAILRNAEAAELFLQDPVPDLEEVRAILGDIQRDDRRAGDVIDRLRAMLKRRDDLEASPIAVDGLLAEATGLARADAAARRVTIEIEAAPELPPIRGDRVHLQQVLLNLLLNAMDAVAAMPDAARRVCLRAGRNGGGTVEITVRDAGPGIAAGKLGEIFEPFFTTKAHGMGMGLAISRTIIEAHRGQIWAENNAGEAGATFRFTLPVATEEAAA